MLKRHEALEETKAKFAHRSFDWQTGATCIHMLRFHLRRLGHKVPAIPKLDGPIAAKRELKKHGWNSVEAMLDELLTPISVAAMWPGDVSVLPGDNGLGGIVISLGDTAIGYAEDVPGLTLFTDPAKVLERAWRV